jgi:hypothetical protein
MSNVKEVFRTEVGFSDECRVWPELLEGTIGHFAFSGEIHDSESKTVEKFPNQGRMERLWLGKELPSVFNKARSSRVSHAKRRISDRARRHSGSVASIDYETKPTTRNFVREAKGPTLSTSKLSRQDDAEWMEIPEEILERIASDRFSKKERNDAILIAEITSFDSCLTHRLLDSLGDFIDKNRFSDNSEVITLVGSAIRKFAMNMEETYFDRYATFFAITDNKTLSCALELELSKALGWRLLTVPHELGSQFSGLSNRVSDLASDYLAPRLILQENYASIALHALLCSYLLNVERVEEFTARVMKLNFDWFRKLLARRLEDSISKRTFHVHVNSSEVLCIKNHLELLK